MKDDRVMWGLFIFAMLALAASIAISAFKSPGSKDQTITFKVIAADNINITNTTLSLVQLHFECIKYCSTINSAYYSSCWEQCGKLGQEGCR